MADDIEVGMKCIKYMLFVSNFMFVMIGFLLISIGSTIKAIYGDFEQFMEVHYFSPSVLAIAIGVVIFFVALFGCVGAVKESTCLINLFGFFLTILLIMEISAAIAAYAMRGQIETSIRRKMSDSIYDYNNDPYDRDIWDFTQQRLYCCGIDGANDWYSIFSTTTEASTSSSTTISHMWQGPSSCCRPRYGGHGDVRTCPRKEVFKDGCLDALTYVVSESALLLGCGALAVAFIQLLGIIFAWMLAKAVRRLKTQKLIERDQDRQRAYEQMGRGKDDNPTPVLYTPTYSEA
ncbi:CD63 antigen [Tribolium madens]|uniref:CD63 antigen n=1 Tax=Tribolium madens TaxID=41895 RepID=UPI001CF74F68|nr:CD63 antigen [Tribolium madens]